MLLPTPTTRDFKDGQAAHRRDGVIQTDTLARVLINGAERERERELMSENLLPTPNTMEHREVKTPEQIAELKERSPGGYRNLRESVINELEDAVNWGKFEPAIRRWEAIIGRPAPAPTLPDGKDGAHRLSPWLTEWMMGLPEGWICSPEIGLTRNEQLKAAGNGVVPQQAELALRMLLEGVDIRTAGGGQVNLPTPTVSDTFTSNLKSSQQKEGSMHSVTLPQAVERLVIQ